MSDIPEGYEAVTDQLAFTEKGWRCRLVGSDDKWFGCAPNMTQCRSIEYVKPVSPKQVVYLAGPMRSIPFYNFPAFDEAEFAYLTAGYDVISPASLDRKAGFNAMTLPQDTDWSAIPTGFDFNACVERDLEAVKKCDIIYMLDGWEKSKGAKAELALAEWLGKRVIYQTVNPIDVKPVPQDGEVRVVDAVTGGQKGSKPCRLDLVPWDAMWEVGELYGAGAAKYEDRNWEKGYAWHLSHAALHRHLAQFWQFREKADKETGRHHLASVVFHALALMAFEMRGIGTDDRPKEVVKPS